MSMASAPTCCFHCDDHFCDMLFEQVSL
jgi:hypothetical protein